MAKGNTIILSSNPKGQFIEGTIGDTSKPGTIMQIEAATTDKNGRPTLIAAAPGADGKKVMCAVLLEDNLQGKLISDAYVSGTRCRAYVPAPGEEINVRYGETAGTGNSVTIGDRLIVNATGGYLIPESGSPEDTPFVARETLTQQAADALVFCVKT